MTVRLALDFQLYKLSSPGLEISFHRPICVFDGELVDDLMLSHEGPESTSLVEARVARTSVRFRQEGKTTKSAPMQHVANVDQPQAAFFISPERLFVCILSIFVFLPERLLADRLAPVYERRRKQSHRLIAHLCGDLIDAAIVLCGGIEGDLVGIEPGL